MRVPTGSICGLISTAALRSKRMIEPSGRRMSLATRTTTAFITSPFFTRPRGMASFTDTTMTSPMVAYFRFEPPSTLMHMTRRAPELSATSRLVCIWIMGRLVFSHCARARLFRPFLAPGHRPALELRYRPVFFDPHDIAGREFVLLVVRVIPLRSPHRFFQNRMRKATVDTDHDGLVLFVAYDDALQHPLRHPGLLTSTLVAPR